MINSKTNLTLKVIEIKWQKKITLILDIFIPLQILTNDQKNCRKNKVLPQFLAKIQLSRKNRYYWVQWQSWTLWSFKISRSRSRAEADCHLIKCANIQQHTTPATLSPFVSTPAPWWANSAPICPSGFASAGDEIVNQDF